MVRGRSPCSSGGVLGIAAWIRATLPRTPVAAREQEPGIVFVRGHFNITTFRRPGVAGRRAAWRQGGASGPLSGHRIKFSPFQQSADGVGADRARRARRGPDRRASSDRPGVLFRDAARGLPGQAGGRPRHLHLGAPFVVRFQEVRPYPGEHRLPDAGTRLHASPDRRHANRQLQAGAGVSVSGQITVVALEDTVGFSADHSAL